MKKTLSLLLVLVLALSALPAALSEEDDGFYSETAFGLLYSADAALEEGKDPAWIRQEMERAAGREDLTDQLSYTCENIAALDNAHYRAIQRVLGDDMDSDRYLGIFTPLSGADDYLSSWNAYEMPEVSEELTELLRDDGAEYCFKPAWWSESEFQTAFGMSYTKFTPSRPRPGYVCVVLTSKSQAAPERKWNDTKDDTEEWELREAIDNSVRSLAWALGEEAPVLTGNPHLASAFWVIDRTYSFYAYYGSDREVKGYNCKISLTVESADKKQKIAQISETEELGGTIYSWSDGISAADTPDLSESSGYSAFVSSVRSTLARERAAAQANQPVTAGNAERKLAGTLAELADSAEDPWEKAIYESGAKNVQMDSGTLSFQLSAFDPGLDQMDPYEDAENAGYWLSNAFSNASYSAADFTLRVVKGIITHTSVTNLKKAVKAAAQTAKDAFQGADMTAAFRNWLLPSPISGKLSRPAQLLSPSDSFLYWVNNRMPVYSDFPAEALACVFYAQKSLTVDTSGGPYALKLKGAGPDAGQLLSDAVQAALDELAFMTAAKRPDTQELFEQILAQTAVREKGSGGSYTYTLSVTDGLQLPRDYRAWLENADYSDKYDQLTETADLLLDQAAQDMPKNGRLDGGRNGTEVILKLSEASRPTYVQLRRERDGKVVASAFIHPGKEVSVRVPGGQYIVLYCSGPYWYGEEDLFGVLGSYNKSEPTQIKENTSSRTYTHTFTLETTEGGDVTIYDANPSDFRK